MAAKTKPALILAGRTLAVLLLALGLFVLAGWIGSSVPRNGDWTEPESGIEIMAATNGVHTELVLPLVTPQKDWRREFPASDLEHQDRPYTHISVSWGQRDVFLNTPTWADLKPITVWHAITGSEALMHVSHYVRPAPGENFRPITLRADEYIRLVEAIEAQSLPAEERAKYPGYYSQDVFYETGGSYHVGNTCNQWTGDMLAAAGVKIGLWTPFSGGVMKWVERP
ncbi:DUF2459 domain-containing protein [Altererythrobacter sp. MF3-039]|uniref:DUF2459 domain-containing protein n=1 Tax=Altererythrobacter sp. MF3-039 TaxID=3252901 RepID=UPI00390CAB93